MALRFNLNGGVTGSPYHFACSICVRISGVTLDGELDGALDGARDGMLNSTLDGA